MFDAELPGTGLPGQIRTIRMDIGMTVVELAEVSGVSRRMLTQIDHVQANPSLATVEDRVRLGYYVPCPRSSPRSGARGGVPVWSSPRGSRGIFLRAVETPSTFVEMWEWVLFAGDEYETRATPGAPDSMIHMLSARSPWIPATQGTAGRVVPRAIRRPARVAGGGRRGAFDLGRTQPKTLPPLDDAAAVGEGS